MARASQSSSTELPNSVIAPQYEGHPIQLRKWARKFFSICSLFSKRLLLRTPLSRFLGRKIHCVRRGRDIGKCHPLLWGREKGGPSWLSQAERSWEKPRGDCPRFCPRHFVALVSSYGPLEVSCCGVEASLSCSWESNESNCSGKGAWHLPFCRKQQLACLLCSTQNHCLR